MSWQVKVLNHPEYTRQGTLAELIQWITYLIPAIAPAIDLKALLANPHTDFEVDPYRVTFENLSVDAADAADAAAPIPPEALPAITELTAAEAIASIHSLLQQGGDSLKSTLTDLLDTETANKKRATVIRELQEAIASLN